MRIRKFGRAFVIVLYDDQGAICGEPGVQDDDPPLLTSGRARADAGNANASNGQYGLILCFGEGLNPLAPLPLTFDYDPATDALDTHVGAPYSRLRWPPVR